MRAEQERPAGRQKIHNPVGALGLEALIAHREGLVDDQDIGLGRRGDRERESQEHARGVGANRLVDEVAEFRELDDCVRALGDFLSGEPLGRAGEKDVLATGELAMKPRTQFQDGTDPAANLERAFARNGGPRGHGQKRALAGTVVPDES